MSTREKETYLPSDSRLAASNEAKARELYQMYLQRHKSRPTTVMSESAKPKRLSLQHSFPLEVDGSTAEQNSKLVPFGSSLTRIILDQCQIENN